MFTIPFYRENVLTTSISDASTLSRGRTMTELMQQIREPSSHPLSNSVGSIPQTIVSSTKSSISDLSIPKNLRKGNDHHSTPASNLKLAESVRNAQHDASPNLVSSKMSVSKSYTQGLNNSAGTVSKMPSSQSMKSNLSLLGDISPNHTHFFEVMYVGKIRVSHKRVPFTFIDDALPKFRAYDAKKQRLLNSSLGESSFESVNTSQPTNTSTEDNSFKDETESITTLLKHSPKKPLLRGTSQLIIPSKPDIPKQRDRSASQGSITPLVEQNRTMVFLIGRSDLRLISPDRKQVLLYKDFKDVASCAQGQKNANHFGIICREGSNIEGFIGYVFKCQSESVCDDIVSAISQAFVTCSEQQKKESQIFSCDHCPMLWYHKLCADTEGLTDKKTNTTILRRIEQLTEDEQDMIWAKFYGADKTNNDNIIEQNQFLMMLLRAHCESRQQRHVHDTAENRSEFLNQYLGGSTIFKKAKRSLTSSFDHLLKRKTSISATTPTADCGTHSLDENSTGSEGSSDKSPREKPSVEQVKSPMMDIFLKVGNNPKDSSQHQGSWRQAILNSVVTPSKNGTVQYMTSVKARNVPTKKRTKEELRDLWKIAIRQTILLSRMEKENAYIQAKQNENELKKMKLDYETIIPCDRQLVDRWEMIIEKDASKVTTKKDPKFLLQAIRNGVPRQKRGDVWSFLADQHSLHIAPVDKKKFPNFNTPYKMLLKNLTEHQHAIFIDLGRTFPKHQFYKDPLGIGQLSLFNLLKAYSILDPELGYCQGLGFICGVLLLHCEEEEAFQLLKHLMFRRKMRTKYLPDMKEFQLQLYQLSRLVKDYLPEIYEWLDKNDVSPTLYAAPWILTVFSSQFPLGFVARAFDFLFLESSEIIFKFAIGLLTVHKDELLKRDNFEHIMDYLKNTVPKVDADVMEKVLKIVHTMDVSHQLNEYQVEYNVLQEEITSSNHHIEMLKKEQSQNRHLESQLQFAHSNIAQLEHTRVKQQSQISALQTDVQNLELNIQILGHYVNDLLDNYNIDQDLTSDVRRILQNLDDVEKQRKKASHFSSTDRKLSKSLSLNSHLCYPHKKLEEIVERGEENFSSPEKTKPNGAHVNPRPNRLLTKSLEIDEDDDINLNISDSGLGTPLNPTPSSVGNSVAESNHPLSMCTDVSVKFNGTTQLKTVRPFLHTKSQSFHHLSTISTPSTLTSKDKG